MHIDLGINLTDVADDPVCTGQPLHSLEPENCSRVRHFLDKTSVNWLGNGKSW